MLSKKNIQTEINECITFLMKNGLSHDQEYAHIKSYGKTHIIKTTKASIPTLKFTNIDEYNEIFDLIHKNRQFTVLMFDNTIVNIEYTFTDNELDKSRCLILPDLRLYAGDDYYEDYLDSRSNIDLEFLQKHQLRFPFRIDYDKASFKAGTHPSSHIHLGFSEGCRIPISCALSPRMIFQFIIENFYNPSYMENKKIFDDFFKHSKERSFDKDIHELDTRKLFFDIHLI